MASHPPWLVQRADGTWLDLTLSGYLPVVEACEAAQADLDAALHGGKPPIPPLKLAAIYRAALAKARGES